MAKTSDMNSAADALIAAADRAGENSASSAYDKTFRDFQLPDDPSAIGRQYGDVASSLYRDLGIGGALESSRSLTRRSGEADAAAVFEKRIEGEELSKTPIADLDGEIDRLSEQRWGILPAVLGRSDIIDYGEKLRIGARAEQIMDGEIDKLVKTRERIARAAEGRAKDRVETLKAEAAILDKQRLAAENDLSSRIDLFKEGNGTFNDVVQAALALKRIKDDAAGSGEGNPYMGLGGDGEFTPEMVRLFGEYERTGDFPGVDSSKTQLKIMLTNKYGAWVQAGRPGSKVKVAVGPVTGGDPHIPEGMSVENGMQYTEQDVSTLYDAPVKAKESNAAAALRSILEL